MLGLREIEGDLDDADLGRDHVTSKPASLNTPSHGLIPRQDLRDETADTSRRGDLGKVVEQERAEPVSLLVVADRERDLGDVVGLAEIVGNADDLVAGFDDQREVPLVDVGSGTEICRGGRGRRGEEPAVARLVGQ